MGSELSVEYELAVPYQTNSPLQLLSGLFLPEPYQHSTTRRFDGVDVIG